MGEIKHLNRELPPEKFPLTQSEIDTLTGKRGLMDPEVQGLSWQQIELDRLAELAWLHLDSGPEAAYKRARLFMEERSKQRAASRKETTSDQT